MDELMRIAKEHHFTADQLIQEAECVEEYGEWQHMLLLGYSADMLRNAADMQLKIQQEKCGEHPSRNFRKIYWKHQNGSCKLIL